MQGLMCAAWGGIFQIDETEHMQPCSKSRGLMEVVKSLLVRRIKRADFLFRPRLRTVVIMSMSCSGQHHRRKHGIIGIFTTGFPRRSHDQLGIGSKFGSHYHAEYDRKVPKPDGVVLGRHETDFS
jgi:hypothetical protein